MSNDYNNYLNSLWVKPSLLDALTPEYLFKQTGDTSERFDEFDNIKPLCTDIKLNSYWVTDTDRKHESYIYDIPGVPKEKVGVDVIGNLIKITATRVYSNGFSVKLDKDIKIPGYLDSSTIDAKLTDGVLTIRMKRKETVMSSIKKVTVN
jgi:HSP20 family molecular chaperone IbpA